MLIINGLKFNVELVKNNVEINLRLKESIYDGGLTF